MKRKIAEEGRSRAFIEKRKTQGQSILSLAFARCSKDDDSETERSYETCHISKPKMSERLAAMLTGVSSLKET